MISNFEWEDYLKETKTKMAPISNFMQATDPPSNDFEKGSKLEVKDPKSQSNCIATVVGKMGPRIKLRLDGTDSNHDFWRLVDSEDIHPIGYTKQQGKTLWPPVGFKFDSKHWPKFWTKTLAGAKFAKENWFKKLPIPRKQKLKNNFKIGQKLEAIDEKNPHIIGCATIGAVNEKGNCNIVCVFPICYLRFSKS